MGWEMIPNVLDKILGHFTPKERIRKLKDELNKLERERSSILVFKEDEKKSKRLTIVCNRIATIKRMLQNDATGN